MDDSKKEASGDTRHNKFNMFRQDHKLNKNLLNVEHMDDCDSRSMVSDSGFSDISHTTDASVHSVVDLGTSTNPSLRKNYSCADLARLKIQEQHEIDSISKKHKLPTSMLWNWISHQKYGVYDNRTGTPNKLAPHLPEQSIKQIISAQTMRDLNAFGPNGWWQNLFGMVTVVFQEYWECSLWFADWDLFMFFKCLVWRYWIFLEWVKPPFWKWCLSLFDRQSHSIHFCCDYFQIIVI